MSGVEGIPGFEIVDEDGTVLAQNPGTVPAGRRRYGPDGTQQKPIGENRKPTHDYLLRVPRGLWVAFSRKCKNEGITIRQALVFLIEDWVKGKTEIVDLRIRRAKM